MSVVTSPAQAGTSATPRESVARRLWRRVMGLPEPTWLAAVAALALALRLTWIAYSPCLPVSDFHQFDVIGWRLARGQGYVTNAGLPTAYLPVGYPLFLGGVFLVLVAQKTRVGHPRLHMVRMAFEEILVGLADGAEPLPDAPAQLGRGQAGAFGGEGLVVANPLVHLCLGRIVARH